MKHVSLALILLAATAGSALAAGPFDGSWKLNTAKSHFTGDTFTYAKTAKGFRYSNGATVSYDFAIDGKDYPTLADRTVAWTAAGKDGWDTTVKAHGKVLNKTHRTLSADGKSLTAAYTEFNADGTVTHEGDVFARVSGSGGLAGEWKDVKAKVASDTVTVSTHEHGGFEVSYPTDKETITGRTDGSPTAIVGPDTPPGAMAAYKAVSPRHWDVTITMKGKTYSKGSMEVSADGKSLSRTSWVPGKESEKSVAVYDKS